MTSEKLLFPLVTTSVRKSVHPGNKGKRICKQDFISVNHLIMATTVLMFIGITLYFHPTQKMSYLEQLLL